MPDVDKMRVVLQHDSTIDMHTSALCQIPEYDHGHNKLCAYLHRGGDSVEGILLLLAHCKHNPVDDATVGIAFNEGLPFTSRNTMVLGRRISDWLFARRFHSCVTRGSNDFGKGFAAL